MVFEGTFREKESGASVHFGNPKVITLITLRDVMNFPKTTLFWSAKADSRTADLRGTESPVEGCDSKTFK